MALATTARIPPTTVKRLEVNSGDGTAGIALLCARGARLRATAALAANRKAVHARLDVPSAGLYRLRSGAPAHDNTGHASSSVLQTVAVEAK